jgi:creatinine amidohydrolase
MSFYYWDKTWEEIKEYVDKNALIILPVGTTEEHGAHLPLKTDTAIAEGFAYEIAKNIENKIPVLVMPAIWAGYSPKSMDKWPGTMMVRIPVFIDYVHDICASLVNSGFKKIVILDCHGQHSSMLNIVTKEIADEFDIYMAVTSPLSMSTEKFNKIRQSERGGVLHACEWETSVMLLFSNLVKMDKAVDIDTMKYSSEFVSGDSAMGGQKVTWSTWGLQDSITGVYGDPTKASIETGKAIVDAAIENYSKFIQEYYNFEK